MILPTVLLVLALGAAVVSLAPAAHRYMVERTFPAGALDGLDAAAKASVNANNAALGVTWIHSYANAAKTKTYCVYEGPSAQAVRQAAARNAIPVDRIVDIPLDLDPGPQPAMAKPARRYIVERTFPAHALETLDDAAKAEINRNNATLGVRWVGSYVNADQTKTYCVYEAPSEQAVWEAARKNGTPIDAVTEVPVDLLPD